KYLKESCKASIHPKNPKCVTFLTQNFTADDPLQYYIEISANIKPYYDPQSSSVDVRRIATVQFAEDFVLSEKFFNLNDWTLLTIQKRILIDGTVNPHTRQIMYDAQLRTIKKDRSKFFVSDPNQLNDAPFNKVTFVIQYA